MKTKFLSNLFLLLCLSLPAQAKEIADINIPENITIAGVEQPLKLNGVGIRYKFFFKIYIAALYVIQPSSKAADIIHSHAPKRILMHFLYDEVPLEKLVDGWNEGFEENLSDAEKKSLATDIKRFNQMFETLKQGDEVLLDYLPGKGTRITIKGVEKGVIEGAEFNRALLKIWLGEEPVTEELKEALLGKED